MSSATPRAGAHRLPNIVLVMTDQHRAGFTGGEGFGLDTMPFLDALAARGTRFRCAYTTAPACVPARTSLLTGRFPSAHRVRQNSTPDQVLRGHDLLDAVRGAGYSCHFAGKTHMYRGEADFDTFSGPYWHARGPDETQEQRDFAEWLRSIDHGPTSTATPFQLRLQYPHRIVSDAIQAIDARDQARPFFCWVSFPEPHNPYQAPEPYFSMFGEDEVPARLCGPEAAVAKGGTWRWLRGLIESKRPGYDVQWRRYRATYCAQLRLIDDQIRRLVDHLEHRGLTQDTILVFVADHGDYVGDYGLQRKGAGMPEVLMRIPFVVAGPGVVARDNGEDLVSLADLFPTLCDAIGVEIPFGVQGRSLWPMLTGAWYPREEFDSVYAERGYGGLPYGSDERPELHFPYAGTHFDELNTVTQAGTTRMLRQGRWKVLHDNAGLGELYDLETDPMELNNRWDEPELAPVKAELVERLLLWATRVVDDLPLGTYTPKRAPHNWHAHAALGGSDDGHVAEPSQVPAGVRAGGSRPGGRGM